MSEDEKDEIYYSIEDSETDADPDQSPYNYALVQEEEENQGNENINPAAVKTKNPWNLLMGVMFNPVEGWKKIRRQKNVAERLQSGCFYPLLALFAITKFADFYYNVNVSLKTVISQAVVAFVSYFFGYFSILFILSTFLPKNVAEIFDKDFGKSYILTALCTLVLFSLITNLLPMLWPILFFLPLWTLYLLYQGSRFFKLTESQVLRFLVITCVSIVGVPLFIEWGLNELMPY